MMEERNDSFLQMFEEYYRSHTDASIRYGRLASIQLIGHAMGYHSFHLIQPREVHHNMNLLLIGPSTLSRKTTVQNLARELYPNEKFLPEESSPERFIAELSDNPSRIFPMGEFTGLLKKVKNGSYMSPMVELLNDLFNCPRRYTRKLMNKNADYQVENVYLSCISTVTPEMLNQYLNAEMMSGGFLARWLLSYGEPKPQPRKRLAPDALQIDRAISYGLQELLRMGEKPTFFELTDDGLKRYNKIESKAMQEHSKTLPFVGRYMNYVIAIADILLVSDAIGRDVYRLRNFSKISDIIRSIRKISKLGGLVKQSVPNYTNQPNQPNYTNYLINGDVIEEREIISVPAEYIDRAWEIVRPCLDYADRLIDFIEMDLPTSKLKQWLERKNNAPAKYSDAMRNTNLNATKMRNAIETLHDREELLYFFKKETTKASQILCLTKNVNTSKCKACPYREY